MLIAMPTDRNPKAEFDNVLRHLKNKQIGVFPTGHGLRLSVLDRLLRRVTRARTEALRKGWQVVVSEQVLEVPLLIRHLRSDDRRILDFGGFESLLPLSFAALGHHVTVLDQRPYPFSPPELRPSARDIFGDLVGLAGDFDAVLSISTIEHLGLGSYGDIRRGGRRPPRRRAALVTGPPGRPVACHRSCRGSGGPQGISGIRPAAPAADVPPPLDQPVVPQGRAPRCLARVDAAEAEQVRYQLPDASMPVEAVVFVICEKP